MLPLIAKITIGVGALSYAGQFNITVVADPDAVVTAAVVTGGEISHAQRRESAARSCWPA